MGDLVGKTGEVTGAEHHNMLVVTTRNKGMVAGGSNNR